MDCRFIHSALSGSLSFAICTFDHHQFMAPRIRLGLCDLSIARGKPETQLERYKLSHQLGRTGGAAVVRRLQLVFVWLDSPVP